MVDRSYIRINTSLTPGIVLAMVASYFFAHYLQHTGRGPELVRFYAKDFLLVPLLISATEITAQFLNRPIAIRTREVIVAVVAVSVAFEWLIPTISASGEGDIWDIAMYTAGGLFFLLLSRWRGRTSWANG